MTARGATAFTDRACRTSGRTDERDTLRATHAAVSDIETIVESIFSSLDELGEELVSARRVARSMGRPFTSHTMCAVQPAIFHVLDTVGTTHSAGIFVAEGVLDDVARGFEWWHRGEAEHGYEPLLLDLNLESPDCYDYYEMEWFRVARTSGVRHVTGPLIDLPCASVLVMTFATPVMDGTEFLGIAGADVKVAQLESHLIKAMRRAVAPSVLVNENRRVVASNSARWRAADRLATPPADAAHEWQSVVEAMPDLGWSLAVQSG